MKQTLFFALIAASCLTSACGKDSDSKKSEPKETIIHIESDEGYCLQAVQEQVLALGLTLTDAMPGACPAKSKLANGQEVSLYASCPITTEEGLAATLVYYNKSLNDEGEVIDVTLFTPQALCSLASQQ